MLPTFRRLSRTSRVMRPPDSVLRACLRWLDLLRRNSVAQGWALLAADPRYTDLTRTQYHAGLEWLIRADLVQQTTDGLLVAAPLRTLPSADIALEVMARALALDPPAWLANADQLVPDASDLPLDADQMASALGLDNGGALAAVQRAHRKVDAALMAETGAHGEHAVVSLLEARWPGSTSHVATFDDTAGYDIAFTLDEATWHLEVKATTRLGRLVVYLSRNEHSTALADPRWRLVVVGLTPERSLGALATARAQTLANRAPRDVHPAASWSSVRHTLAPSDLLPGLCLAGTTSVVDTNPAPSFAWMP